MYTHDGTPLTSGRRADGSDYANPGGHGGRRNHHGGSRRSEWATSPDEIPGRGRGSRRYHRGGPGRRDGFNSPDGFSSSDGGSRHGFNPREDFGGPGGRDSRGGGPRGGGPRGDGPRGGRRRRGRSRGDVRAAILLLLDEQPRHGYDLIQEITDRSAGAWTPSPGSIYPTLQILEDEGLVTIAQIEGRRTASLTDAGAEYVADNRAQLGTPWDSGSDRSADLAIRKEILALKDAAAQVVRVGSPAQYAAATEVLATARRELYRILAGDDDAPLT